MTPEQALENLNKIAEAFTGNRAQHQALGQSYLVLKNLLDEKAKEDNKKEEAPKKDVK